MRGNKEKDMRHLPMKFSGHSLKAICLSLMTLAVCAAAQIALDYDGLVQQGKTQLQSGNKDAALASANAAIKANAERWEAYAVAGGALMNLKRYEEAADQFGHAIDQAPAGKQAGLRDLRRQCLAAETATASAPGSDAPPTASQPSGSQSGPPLQEILAWLTSNMPPQVEPPYRHKTIEIEAQELAFQGCTGTFTHTFVKYQNQDRPAGKRGVTATVIDLAKLSADAAAVWPDGPAVQLHSDRGFPTHTKDWILSTDAILRHETVPDELDEEDDQPAIFGYYAHDNDLAARMVHAWHDAIVKCTAKAVPANLY